MRNACRILVKISIENHIEKSLIKREDNIQIERERERFEDEGWK
jgi:hypothetical protein